MPSLPTAARRAGWLLAVALLALPGALPADDESLREFDSEAERERYYELLEELRCLVCQNESLASSSADLAEDMRDEVYRLVVEEDRSSEAAIQFLTERYGDFVLFRPPFQPSTYLLWFGPFVLLAGGAGVLAAVVRSRRNAPEPKLSSEDRVRAEQMLDEDEEDPPR